MYIVEATGSENRTTHGSMGDQTGREICISNFYSYPWDVVLYCKDDTLRRKAAQIAQEIASNPSFGYSQPNRWTGYNSIVANGGKVAGAQGDFDCSSLVISCYALAGLPIPTGIGYTGTIEQTFLATGKFEALRGQHTLDYMRGAIGCIYLNTANHTAIGITDEGLRPRYATPSAAASIPSIDINDTTAANWGGKITVPLDTCSVKLPMLQNGSVGHSVVMLQTLLLANGGSLPTCGADGEYGNETSNAVRALQQRNGLDVDGIVGAQTWACLLWGGKLQL